MGNPPQGAGPYKPPDESPLQTFAAEETAHFKQWHVPPPSAQYVTLDDQLFITDFGIVSGLSILVRGRVLRADGTIFRFVTRFLSNGGPNGFTRIVPLAEGYLLDVTVLRDTSSTQRGTLFVQVSLGRGISTDHETSGLLISGYVAGIAALGWPNSILCAPTDGQGRIYRFNNAAPAAGANFTITVPTGTRWRVQSLIGTLVSDANVANRQVFLRIDDGATIYFEMFANTVQAAGVTDKYIWSARQVAELAGSGDIVMAIPVNLVIEAGHRITSAVASIQVGDQWSAQSVLVEEWVSPI
jgi:hypothetical protein